MLAAPHIALGEHADLARNREVERRPHRSLLRQLRRASTSRHARYRCTCDVAHGHQQLSLFNAHYDERCFLPIHVYDTTAGRPVAIILRPGKTPSARKCAAICAGLSAASARTGRQPRSPSEAMAIMAAAR